MALNLLSWGIAHTILCWSKTKVPFDLYFPTLREETEKFCINHYVADIQKCVEQTLEVAQKHNKNDAL